MNTFKPALLASAISAVLINSNMAFAAEDAIEVDKSIETIQITATRRAGSVQDAPLNITALNGDVISDQNIGDLEDVARWVPGLTISDQGGREGSPIIVRGLNTNTSDRISDSGTVATYVGEIPLSIDLRLTDVDRVEVLIGPQGTLYGAGTLGGAMGIPDAIAGDWGHATIARIVLLLLCGEYMFFSIMSFRAARIKREQEAED